MARLRIFGPKARPESMKRNRCENCGRVLLYEGIKLLDYATSVAAGISIYKLGRPFSDKICQMVVRACSRLS